MNSLFSDPTTERYFFRFEEDFVAGLRCIPMIARFKLDCVGIKLSLSHWQQFKTEERQLLVTLPCLSSTEHDRYRDLLVGLVLHYTGQHPSELLLDPIPEWSITYAVPSHIEEHAQTHGVTITLPQWQSLSAIARFALLKLSRSRHEHRNFQLALEELGLV